MKRIPVVYLLFFLFLFVHSALFAIPLPEHPRPDFERTQWLNLNGQWAFKFDSLNVGLEQHWSNGESDFNHEITVPFPWGSKLSKVGDLADIGWYKRQITVPKTWQGQRIFLTIGASDWHTTVWLNGQKLGEHQGGYVPFDFELTDFVTWGQAQTLVVRADDIRRDFTLYGKQGYGNARGIWQTVYLEARGEAYLDELRIIPDIDSSRVTFSVGLAERAVQDVPVSIEIETESGLITGRMDIPKGDICNTVSIDLPNPHLWDLDDPYLYPVTVTVGQDVVKSYFGMRKISVVNLPGTDYPYVALNNEPVYLQLALDQSYHPDGFYTFPSDSFMRNEIKLSKSIGLNGIRPHIKVEIPRKLYWADKLGLLVMQDLPNAWGEPVPEQQAESEYTLRQMIKRDFNHPSIFSWITFNETWGLRTKQMINGEEQWNYLPHTQYWVASMYYLAKSLDPTRLVEDNSICCGAGHTETDINSFHTYAPGWSWDDILSNISENAFPGSQFQFEPGFQQGGQPTINSECGNVWGYKGSTGDVDWSWDYHRMMNSFRIYPEIAGWLYTEHHDVINEWNGYWRFDRSEKYTGMEDFVQDMSLNDMHAPVYLSTGNEICHTVQGGEEVKVPLWLSAMTGADFGPELTIHYQLHFMNSIADTMSTDWQEVRIPYQPWMQQQLEPITVTMPNQSGIATLKLVLKDKQHKVLHHNFMLFVVKSDQTPKGVRIISVPAASYSDQQWSLKQWNVLDGKKVNGAGSGYFEYEIPIDSQTNPDADAEFIIELGAKQLFAKDRDTTDVASLDYMLGARAEPSSNRNAYPMTDEETFSSQIGIMMNDKEVLITALLDDPADHRGVLSWHSQLQDGYLREAGSYGYLVRVPISHKVFQESIKTGKLQVRIETLGDGGIAVYGQEFGRYPIDPSLVIYSR